MTKLRLLWMAVLCLTCVTSSLKAAPVGIWEGVVRDPARPLVANVDFDKRVVRFDATGSTEWKLERLTTGNGTIRFNVTVTGRQFQFTGQSKATKITGEMKTPERSLSFWLERLPVLSAPHDRVEAWQQDLDTVQRFLRYDRSYSDVTRRLVRDRVAQLRSAIARKTDQEIMVELARTVALGGNAHTRLYLVRNRTEVTRLPIRVWWFGDELRVVRATEEHQDLLGCEVTSIESLSTGQAAERVRGIKAGNTSWQRYMSTYMLTSSDILFGAHIAKWADEANFTVKCKEGQRRVQLAPLPLKRSTAAVEAWWDLTPDSRDANAAFLPLLTTEKAPLYLRHTKDNYWSEYDSAAKILYFQYNRSQQSAGDLPIDQFGEQLVRQIAGEKPAAIVVDLRFNTGGDLTVGKPLMKKIADERGSVPIFVITGRATFSAGITHVVELKEWANATIVGEPVGDGLDTWSEGGNLLMPNSKLTLHYGNAFHSYSKREYPDRRPYVEDMSVDSVAPDILVEQTWDDYINGRDPALDAIVRRLNERFVIR